MIGSTVRRLRQERGWSQQFLADRLGIAQSAIGQIERGEINPLLTTLFDLARALDVSPADLVSTPGVPARKNAISRTANHRKN